MSICILRTNTISSTHTHARLDGAPDQLEKMVCICHRVNIRARPQRLHGQPVQVNRIQCVNTGANTNHGQHYNLHLKHHNSVRAYKTHRIKFACSRAARKIAVCQRRPPTKPHLPRPARHCEHKDKTASRPSQSLTTPHRLSFICNYVAFYVCTWTI